MRLVVRTLSAWHRGQVVARPAAVAVKAAIAAGCVMVLVAGCADSGTGGSGTAAGELPSSWPSAALNTATYGPTPAETSVACLVSMPDPTLRDHADLPDDPLRADLVWYPGIRAGTPDPTGGAAPVCRTWHTTLGKTTATALVADLKAEATMSGASFSCGGSGTFVQVWFTTAQGSPSFRIELSCSLNIPAVPGHLGAWPDGMPRELPVS